MSEYLLSLFIVLYITTGANITMKGMSLIAESDNDNFDIKVIHIFLVVLYFPFMSVLILFYLIVKIIIKLSQSGIWKSVSKFLNKPLFNKENKQNETKYY